MADNVITVGSVRLKTNDNADGTQSLDVSLAGVKPQMDDTDKQAVSLYGKGTAAGDTAVEVVSTSVPILKMVTYGVGGVIIKDNVPAGQSWSGERSLHSLSQHHTWDDAASKWDAVRSNVEVTLLASAARTAETNSSDQTNYSGAALIVVVDVTVDPAAAAITPELQIKDSISGNYFTAWTAGTALSATGTAAYLFQPGGAAGSYTEAVNLRLGRTWRFQMNVADSDSMTYSVSAVVLV